MDNKQYSEIFKALGDETRIEIIKLLTKDKLCACEILEKFRITQPTLSFHMKKLTDCQLVKFQKDGKWIHYEINTHMLVEAKLLLETILGDLNGNN